MSVAPKKIEKVIVYVTRGSGTQKQVLVFEHVGIASAGIQVPAGTIERTENAEAAAYRELLEESGLEIKCAAR